MSSETQRFHRQHVREAWLEVAGTRRDLREDRRADEVEREPSLAERTPDGRKHASFAFRPGARLGTFELVEVVQRSRHGHVWRARCDCGVEILRRGSTLAHAARRGLEPACPRCTSERRAAFRDFKADVYRDAWRRQWVDYGTLWTRGQTSRLMQEVRDDLERELGEAEEPAPSLRLGYLELAPGFVEGANEEERQRLYEPLGCLDEVLPPMIFKDAIRQKNGWRWPSDPSELERIRRLVDARHDLREKQGRTVDDALTRAYGEALEKASRTVGVAEERRRRQRSKRYEEERRRYQERQERVRSARDEEELGQPRLLLSRSTETVEGAHAFLASMTREWEEREREEARRFDQAWSSNEGPNLLARCSSCGMRMQWDRTHFPSVIRHGALVPCSLCLTRNAIAGVEGYRILLRASS